jgi:hypothetical protein
MYRIVGADQREYGPISAEQIRQWIGEGRINGQTRIQAEGSTDWKTVAELPELAAFLRPPPATITLAPKPVSANNMLAIWAMVTGIVSLVCCCGIMAPVSIVLGAIALSQIKNNPNQGGKGFAITGIVLGCVTLVLFIIGIISAILSPNFLQSFQNAMNQQ